MHTKAIERKALKQSWAGAWLPSALPATLQNVAEAEVQQGEPPQASVA